MKKNLTELVFILDKSGSMSGLEGDTIGGFNSMLKKQKKEEGDAIVTTVLFSDQYELLHDRLSIRGVSPLSEDDYQVGGMTALLDAIGSTIQKIGNVQKRTNEGERADRVLFVITTDGMENASCEYKAEQIKKMINHQKEKYNWEFIFLGANIDALATAEKFGIDKDFAVNYHADERGTTLNYEAVSQAVTNYRRGHKLNKAWKREIEKDFQARKRK